MSRFSRIYRATGRMATLVGGVLLLSTCAMAELGGTETSVRADQQRLNGTRSVTQAQAYALHEIRTPENNVIHEYISPDGKVFAVSYTGKMLGESNAILSAYSRQIARAMVAVRNGKHRGGPVNIELPGLVYHATGHMRSYMIRAYLPDSVPQGVTVEALR